MNGGIDVVGLIGEKPRPRVLIVGLTNQPEIVSAVRALAPTVRCVSDYSTVRQAEWDCVVTDQPWISKALNYRELAEPHLSVIYIAGSAYRDIEHRSLKLEGEDVVVRVSQGHNLIVNEFLSVPEELPAPVRRLVQEGLLPAVTQREQHTYFQSEPLYSTGDKDILLATLRFIRPFLLAASGNVLAGWYPRTPASEAWLLPSDSRKLGNWIRAALRIWHDKYPVRFPRVLDWAHEPRWQTATERDLSGQLAALRQERDEALAALARRSDDLERELSSAADLADRGIRRLLTAESNDLVDAVAGALTSLGFTATPADEAAKPGDLLEDLRITVSEEPTWIALSEVRSYGAGAQLGDLLRIARFVTRYVQTNRSVPSARWYIVSQFRGQDPASRPQPLVSHPNEVQDFADDGGLLIDTAQLFELVTAVEEGRISADEVRGKMMQITGVLAASAFFDSNEEGA